MHLAPCQYQTCKYLVVFLTNKACNDTLRHSLAGGKSAVAPKQERLLSSSAISRALSGGKTLGVFGSIAHERMKAAGIEDSDSWDTQDADDAGPAGVYGGRGG